MSTPRSKLTEADYARIEAEIDEAANRLVKVRMPDGTVCEVEAYVAVEMVRKKLPDRYYTGPSPRIVS